MKTIFYNYISIYLLRLITSLAVYPAWSLIGKHLLKNDIYQYKFFTFGSIWFYFIYQIAMSAIWAVCFYLISTLMNVKMKITNKLAMICITLLILEILVAYQHEIIKNRTFFANEIYSVDFIQNQVGNLLNILIFIYFYTLLNAKIIKRPSTLP
jgi:hypothetical protein